jgi:proline iminopeptidase
LERHTPAAYRRLAKEGFWAEGFWAFVHTSRYAHQALNQSMAKGYNCLSDISRITVPCLVLCGEHDRHITAQASLETARHLPQAEYRCYANTAHLLPWEIPEDLLNDIQAWPADHAP